MVHAQESLKGNWYLNIVRVLFLHETVKLTLALRIGDALGYALNSTVNCDVWRAFFYHWMNQISLKHQQLQ